MTPPTHPSTRHRVLVVDDHPVVRLGLQQIIDREPDLQSVGEACNSEETLLQVEDRNPEVVIVDISLEGEDGMDLIRQLKTRWPLIRAIACSFHEEQAFAGRALQAGAVGYVSKRDTLSKIVEAVRSVLRGEVYLSPQIAANLLQRAAAGKPLHQDPVETLSKRELEVFTLIGQGLNAAQIAQQLDLSLKTVEAHRKVIKTKLQMPTLAQLSRCAFQWVQQNG